jgi:hypothetical protein
MSSHRRHEMIPPAMPESGGGILRRDEAADADEPTENVEAAESEATGHDGPERRHEERYEQSQVMKSTREKRLGVMCDRTRWS